MFSDCGLVESGGILLPLALAALGVVGGAAGVVCGAAGEVGGAEGEVGGATGVVGGATEASTVFAVMGFEAADDCASASIAGLESPLE